jgi:hypothetical protein
MRSASGSVVLGNIVIQAEVKHRIADDRSKVIVYNLVRLSAASTRRL